MAFIASRVYIKPLFPERTITGGGIDNILKRAKTDLLRRVRKRLKQEVFSDRAKKALAKSIRIEIKPSSLQITAKHPAFGPLVMGQKSEQMRWLTKARKPIPIVTENGDVIFRSATAKSMMDGKWIHPGRRPSDFVSKAKEESRNFLKNKIKKEVQKNLKKSWRSGP